MNLSATLRAPPKHLDLFTNAFFAAWSTQDRINQVPCHDDACFGGFVLPPWRLEAYVTIRKIELANKAASAAQPARGSAPTPAAAAGICEVGGGS